MGAAMTSRGFTFAPAERKAKRIRLGIESPSGGGKTYWLLQIATALAEHDQGKIAVLDTEHGSSSMYGSGRPFTFDVANLTDKEPAAFVDGMLAAAEQGYTVLGIDSASHEWKGTLGIVDRTAPSMRDNSWAAWSRARPAHDAFIETMLSLPMHVVATYRSKQDSQQVKRDGRTVVEKLGLAPVASDDTDYEFDLWGAIDHETHVLTITKSRIDTITIGSTWHNGAELVKAYLAWVDDAEYEAPPPSDEQLKAQLSREMNARGVKGSQLVAFLGETPAGDWLRDHGNNVIELVEAARAIDPKAARTRQAPAAPRSATDPAPPPASEPIPPPAPVYVPEKFTRDELQEQLIKRDLSLAIVGVHYRWTGNVEQIVMRMDSELARGTFENLDALLDGVTATEVVGE